MAESLAEQKEPLISQEGQTPEQEMSLKYFYFVHLATLRLVMCLSTLYDYAKESSGSLKPGVETVEGTVKSVVGPVYEKFHDVPFGLLKFVDRKVDESLNELKGRVPPAVKEASAQAYTAAQRAPEVARSVAGEVQRAGVVGTAVDLAKGVATRCEPTAKQLYARYEPVAEQYAVATWHALNRLPLFHQAAEVMVPTAAHLSDRYNSAVCYGAEKGYTVAAYLPLVPSEKIAKVFGAAGGEAAPAEAH